MQRRGVRNKCHHLVLAGNLSRWVPRKRHDPSRLRLAGAQAQRGSDRIPHSDRPSGSLGIPWMRPADVSEVLQRPLRKPRSAEGSVVFPRERESRGINNYLKLSRRVFPCAPCLASPLPARGPLFRPFSHRPPFIHPF